MMHGELAVLFYANAVYIWLAIMNYALRSSRVVRRDR